MDITRVKYWKKTVQQEVVDHVKISYKDDGKDITLHEYGNNSTAAPEFYKAMEDFSPVVCTLLGLPKELTEKFSLLEIGIRKSEDKEGTDNTEYSIITTMKTGVASTSIKIDIQHKYIPNGFREAVFSIVAEAEEYVGGTRAQLKLDLDDESKDE